MPKTKKSVTACYNKKALKASMRKGYLMRAIEDRLAERQPLLSTYGAQPYLQQPLVSRAPLARSRAGLLEESLLSDTSLFGPSNLVGRSRRARLGTTSAYSLADPKDIDSLESLMTQIEEEMYDQEEKARRSCVEGEETALHRYQAMSDLLDDATDALEEIQANPSASLELPKYISLVKSRFARARKGRLSDYDASSLVGI